MPALREILARRAPLLLLDAASARVQVGLLGPGNDARWSCASEEAGTGLFRCLEELSVKPDDIAAFAFCEGPGSMLGIRTTAMVLRTWTALKARPLYAYQSLELVARALRRRGVRIIADARRDAWHCTEMNDDGQVQPLRRVPTTELSGTLLMPEGFRHWSALPAAGVTMTPYDLASLLPRVADVDLFHETAEPDAYLHEQPVYATWTPQVHQAPPSA